jgi:hypothetical protein
MTRLELNVTQTIEAYQLLDDALFSGSSSIWSKKDLNATTEAINGVLSAIWSRYNVSIPLDDPLESSSSAKAQGLFYILCIFTVLKLL